MLKVELDKSLGIALLTPDGKLTENDFVTAASIIDPFIVKTGLLSGIVIVTREFPGWETFGSMLRHLKFVKEHHKKIAYVALVTDSRVGDLAELIIDHFVSARIKHFAFDELEDAKKWILNRVLE
jgi:hypothetical protein